MMNSDVCFPEVVSYYINEANKGRFEDAFYGLVEQDSQIIPYIEKAYNGETSTDLRVMLLQALAQFHNVSSIGFFEVALSDPNSEIWKASLDGLVSIGGSESLLALSRSLANNVGTKRSEWIEEAIEQIKDEL